MTYQQISKEDLFVGRTSVQRYPIKPPKSWLRAQLNMSVSVTDFVLLKMQGDLIGFFRLTLLYINWNFASGMS